MYHLIVYIIRNMSNVRCLILYLVNILYPNIHYNIHWNIKCFEMPFSLYAFLTSRKIRFLLLYNNRINVEQTNDNKLPPTFVAWHHPNRYCLWYLTFTAWPQLHAGSDGFNQKRKYENSSLVRLKWNVVYTMIKLQTVGGEIHWNNTKIIDSMLQMILWADIGFARKKGNYLSS